MRGVAGTGKHFEWVPSSSGSITEGSWGRFNPRGLISNYDTIKREWRDPATVSRNGNNSQLQR